MIRSPAVRNVFIAALIAASFTPASASAQAEYLCTAVPNSSPILSQAWNQRCLPYFISTDGALLDGEPRRQLILQSFGQWQEQNCTDVMFVDFGYTEQAPGFDPNRDDNQNIIISIESEAAADELFTRRELAITVTSFNTATGEIFDADIMINAANFRFEDVTTTDECLDGNMPLPYDLRNTLVHEIGHFIGFEHDDDAESTMYASAPECETKKRDLTNDNKLGVCNVYGVAQPTRTCAPPDTYDKGPGDPEMFRDQCNRSTGGSSCACTSARPERTSALWIAIIVLVTTGRRTARRRR